MAGAYCVFCDSRCFVTRTIPDGPQAGWTGHLATCARGKAHDRQATGYDADTAINPAAEVTDSPVVLVEDFDDSDNDEDDDVDTIRAKCVMDGASSLEEAAQKLEAEAARLRQLAAEGWKLEPGTTVEDDYGSVIR